jgi:hypothetical protein
MAALKAALVGTRTQLMRWLGDKPDDVVLRALFALLLVVTAGLLVVDFNELGVNGPVSTTPPVAPIPRHTPSTALPATKRADRVDPSAPLPRFDDKLRAPMTFDLGAGGRLIATGAIVPGTADVFAAEIAKRGSYVTTVVLASPGGSVADALAMGRLIRDKKFTTEVEAEHYCASSCPLVFAGGAERRAGRNAAIGVHQVSAMAAAPLRAEEGMQDAQVVSAVCQRYLRDMGVDLEVWVHAMETPSERLFYFRPDELLNLKLATEVGGLPRTAGILQAARTR